MADQTQKFDLIALTDGMLSLLSESEKTEFAETTLAKINKAGMFTTFWHTMKYCEGYELLTGIKKKAKFTFRGKKHKRAFKYKKAPKLIKNLASKGKMSSGEWSDYDKAAWLWIPLNDSTKEIYDFEKQQMAEAKKASGLGGKIKHVAKIWAGVAVGAVVVASAMGSASGGPEKFEIKDRYGNKNIIEQSGTRNEYIAVNDRSIKFQKNVDGTFKRIQ